MEVKVSSDAKEIQSNRAAEVEAPARRPQSHSTYLSKRRWLSRRGLFAAFALLAVLMTGFYFAQKAGNGNTNPSPIRSDSATNESAPPGSSERVSPPSVPTSQTSPTAQAPSVGDDTLAGANCPTNPHSLPNGARLQPDVGISGHGTLTVDNGTSDDATVELVDTDSEDTSRYAYIRAHQKLTMTGIEVGAYHLMFSLGSNWLEDDFTCSPSYSEFENEMVYSEPVVGNVHKFHEMTVTLHRVLQGNARTRTLSRADYHRRTQRRGNSN